MDRIGKKDKAVIKAFTEQRTATGHKLDTDGQQLDGMWMGGRRIASWEPTLYPKTGTISSQIVFHDLGSRSAQQVQRAIAKVAPKFDLKNGRGW